METTLRRTGRKAGERDQSVLDAMDDGTPQGGLRSPVLANRTLQGLAQRWRPKDPQTGSSARKGTPKHVPRSRYAEDCVLTGRSPAVVATAVTPLSVDWLHERGLALSEEQTRRTPLADGWAGLGQPVRQENGQGLPRPSHQTVPPFLPPLRTGITDNTPATA